MPRGGGGGRSGGGRSGGFSGGRGGGGFSGGRGGRAGMSGGRAGFSGRRFAGSSGRSSYRDRYNRRPWSGRRRNVVNNFYGYGGYGGGWGWDGLYGGIYTPYLYDASSLYYPPSTTVVDQGDSYCDVSYVSDVNNAQYRFNQCTSLADQGGTDTGREATRRVCRNTLNQDLSIAQATYGACKSSAPSTIAYTSPYLSFY